MGIYKAFSVVIAHRESYIISVKFCVSYKRQLFLYQGLTLNEMGAKMGLKHCREAI